MRSAKKTTDIAGWTTIRDDRKAVVDTIQAIPSTVTKTFAELTDGEKDDLLKCLALERGLIAPD